jgi:hypothetical protein
MKAQNGLFWRPLSGIALSCVGAHGEIVPGGGVIALPAPVEP